MLEEFDPPASKLIAAQLKRNCRVSDPNAKTPAVVDTSIPGLEGSDAERKRYLMIIGDAVSRRY